MKSIPSVGFKYGIPFRNIALPTPSGIKDLEYAIYSLVIGDREKNIRRAQTSNNLSNFYSKPGIESKVNKQLRKDYQPAHNFLKQNPQIIIGKQTKIIKL